MYALWPIMERNNDMAALEGEGQDYEPTGHSRCAECFLTSYFTVPNDCLTGRVWCSGEVSNSYYWCTLCAKALLRHDLVRLCVVVMEIFLKHNIVMLV